LVGRNYFLDGNLFGDSHRVSKLPWVGDIEGGISVGKGIAALRYGVTYRSREFEGGSVQGFASIWLAIGKGGATVLGGS
jgi:hypothetical protein